MKQIILNSRQQKFNNNIENMVNVELDNSSTLLPISHIEKKLNEYEQYLKECDDSKKYRLLFTINPYCTNILFNLFSECVYKEGSNTCVYYDNKVGAENPTKNYKNNKQNKQNLVKLLKLKRDFLISDTAFSCPKLYEDNRYHIVYHPGLDIFNNHMLRYDDYYTINKALNDDVSNDFNTINDIVRDYYGNPVKSPIDDKNYQHVFDTEKIKTFTDAISDKLLEKNGWVGFNNPSTLYHKNYGDISIDKLINYADACQFIDMYPDRSLYSFTPKVNRFRQRVEKNWEFVLTYPKENVYDNTLVTNYGVNGLEAFFSLEKDINDYGSNDLITIYTTINNNLSIGSIIRIYFLDEDKKKYTVCPKNINVINIGDINGKNKKYYFKIRFSEIADYINDNVVPLRIVRIVDNKPCQYYIRKFERLPNGKTSIFSVTQNKLAFSKTIYNDDVNQLIYNDDIITDGLKDNLGRSLSEIYLTIIKTNNGYKNWYKNPKGDKIEYSHCFGRLDAGFDLPEVIDEYNVHKIHGIDLSGEIEDGDVRKYFKKSSTPLNENEITKDDENFYGDLVEFCTTRLNETVLEDVYFRFNTLQREKISDDFKFLNITEVVSGITEAVNGPYKTKVYVNENGKPIINLNLNPEGYYYKAHYKIRLKEFSDDISYGFHTKINFTTSTEIQTPNNEYVINTDRNYYFNVGDIIYSYDLTTKQRNVITVVKVEGDDFRKITVKSEDTIILNMDKMLLFKHNESMPKEAYDYKDINGMYAWREVVATNNIPNDSELYNSTFTNGRHYIEKNINFYLYRQDPFGYYGMIKDDMPQSMLMFVMAGKYQDVEQYEYYQENEEQC